MTTVKPKGVWRFVEDHEKLQANDLVRETVITDCPWIGSREDHINWRTVKVAMTAWIGKKLSHYKNFDVDNYDDNIEVIRRVHERPSSK